MSIHALAELEHGIVRLPGGAPATGAEACVYVRRQGERVPAVIYRDADATTVLAQPLRASQDGSLPGFVYRRNVEVVASFRGRSVDSAQESERAERARAEAETAAEATAARDGLVAAEKRTRAIRAAEQRAAERAMSIEASAARAAARVAAARASRQAAAAERADALRARARRIAANVARKGAALAHAREQKRADQRMGVPIALREPLTIVMNSLDGDLVVQIDDAGFTARADPDLVLGVINATPGFGIGADGRPYYDTDGPAAGEAAVLGVSQNLDLVLVSQ